MAKTPPRPIRRPAAPGNRHPVQGPGGPDRGPGPVFTGARDVDCRDCGFGMAGAAADPTGAAVFGVGGLGLGRGDTMR